VRVDTGLDEDGMLVFADDRLVAVLVRLSDAHEELGIAGHWYLETKFSLRLTGKSAPFPDLAAARAWIGQHLTEGS
jgi:hypothetical protein